MSESRFDLEYITGLARLELSDAEKHEMSGQLDRIIDFVESLKQVDVEGVEPTSHPFPMDNVVREDESGGSLSHEDAMKNAPKKANGLFMVPKIVE